jgi:hypothetical protein
MNPVLAVLLMFLLAPLHAAAQDFGTLTMREGGLRVIRGTGVFQGVEGMRLRPGDILETAEPAFAQVELTGGALVALGPSTRVYLFSRAGGSGTQLVLLNGWLKGEAPASAGQYRFLTPLLVAATRNGTVVLHTIRESAEAFVESGSATVTGEGRAAGGGPAKAGQFLSRSAGKNVSVTGRMSQAFIDAMPNAFKDTLPPRLSRFAGKKVEPKRDHEVSYPEVAAWLTMPATWRRGFVTRFEPRLADPAFRKAVDAHMNEHPEWDPILHPENYQEKTRPASANAGTPPRRYPQ